MRRDFRTFTAIALAGALAACGGGDEAETMEADAPMAEAPAGDAPAIDAPTTDLVAEDAIEDANWQDRFSPDVSYYNRTGAPVEIRTEPNADRSQVMGTIAPDGAATIQTCAQGSDWCKVDPGSGNPGWVDMAALSGEAM